MNIANAKDASVQLANPVHNSAPYPKLQHRIRTSSILVSLIVAGLLIPEPWVFSFGTACFIGMGLYEFFTLLQKRGTKVFRFFGVAVGIVIPLVMHFQSGQTESGEVLFIVLACLGLFLLQFLRTDKPYAMEGIALTLFGILYISWFLSFLIKIHFMPRGVLLIAFLLIVSKGGDVAAYFTGSMWGRHALIRHISPGKSIEGTIAGIGMSGLLSLILNQAMGFNWSHILAFVFGVFLGIVAQCGDLSESLIKRHCGVKDSSSFLPGCGGFLDVIDSVLFTAPIFYFFLNTRLFS